MIKSIAILGAGNGGFATAADLTRLGCDVRLWGRNRERLDAVRARGGIAMKGIYEGFVPFRNVTGDIREAVDGADLIMLTLPSSALAQCAAKLAPLLTPERIVFINPGHTGGGLHFVAALRAAGYSKPVQTCETVTLTAHVPHDRRLNGQRVQLRRKSGVRVLSRQECNAFLRRAFAGVSTIGIPAPNVFETAFMNINATFHPAGMVMNTGCSIEHSRGDFLFYREGMSPSVARVAEEVDRERIAIANALGIPTMTFLEVFHRVGLTTKEGMQSGSIRAACLASVPNLTVKSPPQLAHRYIYEDVGFGLVPMTELARLAGMPSPAMDALITLANYALGEDLRQTGLTLKKMGIAGKKVSDLSRFAETGK